MIKGSKTGRFSYLQGRLGKFLSSKDSSFRVVSPDLFSKPNRDLNFFNIERKIRLRISVKGFFKSSDLKGHLDKRRIIKRPISSHYKNNSSGCQPVNGLTNPLKINKIRPRSQANPANVLKKKDIKLKTFSPLRTASPMRESSECDSSSSNEVLKCRWQDEIDYKY